MRKNLKKLFAVSAAVSMLAVFAACGDKETGNDTPSPTPTKALSKPTELPQGGEDDPAPTEALSKPTETLSEVKIGDTVKFGSYEQDNDFDNGAEAIEWIVVTKWADGKLLLLSKYALASMPYNDLWINVTWETCTLRDWLNGEFYADAFSETEQGRILTTEVKHGDNPEYQAEGGNDTEDKVFLLSIEEVESYLGWWEDSARSVKLTEYAKRHGGRWSEAKDSHGDYTGNGWWCLRSPGNGNSEVAQVDERGLVDTWGDVVHGYYAVRPAIWLNPES